MELRCGLSRAGARGHGGGRSPRPLDELGGLLGILLCEAAQVHGLLHDAEVLIERKGHVRVTVLLRVPGWKSQTVERSFPRPK